MLVEDIGKSIWIFTMAEPSAALFVENYNVNPFVPNAPFLYPLKTPENRKVFWCENTRKP